MAHYITSACIGVKDGSCVDVCPVDCIHPHPSHANFQSTEMLFIDPDACIDCGLCVDECPVQAIFADHNLPESLAEFIDRNAAFFRDHPEHK